MGKRIKPAPREDDQREDRILFEIVVDAYNETERRMGWYCYLGDALTFPFPAQCVSRDATSPLRVGQAVEVIGMADDDDCDTRMRVIIRYDGAELAVPLNQLQCAGSEVSASTLQAVEDWHYWLARGYEF